MLKQCLRWALNHWGQWENEIMIPVEREIKRAKEGKRVDGVKKSL